MASQLRFDNQTVVVTGAGGGLGRAYSVFFALRGANVVVNDLGGSINGDGKSNKAADAVVNEILAAGGKAVASYDSVENGAGIIQTAIDAFGRVDILINNAGILRDVSFKNMSDQDWDKVMQVHLKGTFICTHAAWPYFKRQNYGRIVNTTSIAGLFGNFGQCNYSAAKLAQVGFSQTLAKEGQKANILCNVIAPISASRMTATVMSPDGLQHLAPELVVPMVAALAHSSNTATGSIFPVGGGYVAKMRWERSRGLILNPRIKLTPGSLLSCWSQVVDFSEPEYPERGADIVKLLETASHLPPNTTCDELDLTGKVAIVTGGGNGLGRAYCQLLAKLGANVIVNDLQDPSAVVEEIRQLGLTAIANNDSVEVGEKIVDAAIKAFGRIDIVVNNAGILRDRSFPKMDEKSWDEVVNTHLRGTYKVTRAAWPYMIKQKWGRIINTTSPTAIYGTFGQTNCAAAKAGIIGLTKALAIEGHKSNIIVNVVCPQAGTNMTRSLMTEELAQALKPVYVAPLIAVLASDKAPTTGQIFEAGSGWFSSTRFQLSGGFSCPDDVPLTPELVVDKWDDIVSFDNANASNPSTGQDVAKFMASRAMSNIAKKQTNTVDYLKAIEDGKAATPIGTEYVYTDRDIILYNLSVGAKAIQLSYVFEKDPYFQALPTYGVIPIFGSKTSFTMEKIVPNFSMKRVLHGEQYLEVLKFPIPTAAKVINFPTLIEVVDKGNAAIIVTGCTTKDAQTGEELFYNESTIFVRGSGGFGGRQERSGRGAPTTIHRLPKRQPDAIVREKTSDDQAALYRLNGDRNPLHIDPDFSKVGGFPVPILHGLCSMGFSARHVVEKYGMIKNIKVRFSGTILPGQTLVTEMWKESNRVIFQTKVEETGKPCISGAGADLLSGSQSRL